MDTYKQLGIYTYSFLESFWFLAPQNLSLCANFINADIVLYKAR